MKSAFGLQGQKCSACSRVYVDRAVADAFLEKLLAKTAAIAIGDPTEQDVYLGPVINARAVETFLEAVGVGRARRDDPVRRAPARRRRRSRNGHYVEPTIAELPLDHELFRRELFVPLLAVGRVSGLDEAIAESNKAEYGLTAGIYSADPQEIERFFDEVEAGVCYANRPDRRHDRRLARRAGVLRAGRGPARPARAGAGPTTSRSSCASRAAPSWSEGQPGQPVVRLEARMSYPLWEPHDGPGRAQRGPRSRGVGLSGSPRSDGAASLRPGYGGPPELQRRRGVWGEAPSKRSCR